MSTNVCLLGWMRGLTEKEAKKMVEETRLNGDKTKISSKYQTFNPAECPFVRKVLNQPEKEIYMSFYEGDQSPPKEINVAVCVFFDQDDGQYYALLQTMDMTLEYYRKEILAEMDKQDVLVVLKNLVASLFRAIFWLHETKKIIHQDIKPTNCFVDHDEAGLPYAILFDWDLCAQWDDARGMYIGPPKAGTQGYAAPEVFMGKNISRGRDFFPVGITIHELLHGYTPWLHSKDSDYTLYLSSLGHQGENTLEQYNGTEEFYIFLDKLMNACFLPDPTQRETSVDKVLSEHKPLLV